MRGALTRHGLLCCFTSCLSIGSTSTVTECLHVHTHLVIVRCARQAKGTHARALSFDTPMRMLKERLERSGVPALDVEKAMLVCERSVLDANNKAHVDEGEASKKHKKLRE